jgi:hypothetical protein
MATAQARTIDDLVARLRAAGLEAEVWSTGGGTTNGVVVLERGSNPEHLRTAMGKPLDENLASSWDALRYLMVADPGPLNDGDDFSDSYEDFAFAYEDRTISAEGGWNVDVSPTWPIGDIEATIAFLVAVTPRFVDQEITLPDLDRETGWDAHVDVDRWHLYITTF